MYRIILYGFPFVFAIAAFIIYYSNFKKVVVSYIFMIIFMYFAIYIKYIDVFTNKFKTELILVVFRILLPIFLSYMTTELLFRKRI